MVDTFAPLELGDGGLAVEDPSYAWTWAGRGPDAMGVLKDRSRFFRSGTSGAGRAVLPPEELRDYEQRVAGLAPAEVVTWLHR